MQIIMLMGPSGSGKTTFAKKFLSEDPTPERVSRASVQVSGRRTEQEKRDVMWEANSPGMRTILLDGINMHERDMTFWEIFCRNHGYDFSTRSFVVSKDKKKSFSLASTMPAPETKVYKRGDKVDLDAAGNPWLVGQNGERVNLTEMVRLHVLPHTPDFHGGSCYEGIVVLGHDRRSFVQSCDSCQRYDNDFEAAYRLMLQINAKEVRYHFTKETAR